MSQNSQERRKHIRFPVRARVVFTWDTPENASCAGEGVTRDIGLTGAFIVSKTCPPVSALVQMEIIFSQSALALAQVTGLMRTQRVECDPSGEAESGFSVTGKGFALRQVSQMPALVKSSTSN